MLSLRMILLKCTMTQRIDTENRNMLKHGEHMIIDKVSKFISWLYK